MANPRSTASIAGHPIHPMIIPFPVAFFVATLAVDIAYYSSGNHGWVTASLWLLGAGLVMGALAAVVGLIDTLGDTRIRNLTDAWLHAGANSLVVLIEALSLYTRYNQGPEAVIMKGLLMSLVAVLLLLFSGWKGWELVYRHKVGVAD